MGSVCSCFEGVAKTEQKPKSGGCAIAGYEDYSAESAPAPAPEAPAVVAAPEPPPKPKTPAPTCPITLDTMQGDWVNSMGAKINVNGTAVTLNGMLMKMHSVRLDDDGHVLSVGSIWQLRGWLEDAEIEFKECPSREVMQFARSVVWSKATTERMEEWNKQMSGLGYSGSSKAPLSRGVEGCIAGSMDAQGGTVARSDVLGDRSQAQQDHEDLQTLNKLLTKWREPGMCKVPPRQVIPDFSNRGHTGLSIEHVHYLATAFKKNGFQKRIGSKGHDIPVLIRDTPQSELGSKAVANWREKLEHESGFPPKEHYEKLFSGSENMFTSLGNGHFNQALNLFLNECDSIYDGPTPGIKLKYDIGGDRDLYEAVHQGPDALVLKHDIPLADRMVISKLLNSKREFKWNVNPDGSLKILDADEDTGNCKQFEAMSKVLDAVELNCLVRAELQVKDSERVGN